MYDVYLAAAQGFVPFNIYTTAEREGCEFYDDILNILPIRMLPVNILIETNKIYLSAIIECILLQMLLYVF